MDPRQWNENSQSVTLLKLSRFRHGQCLDARPLSALCARHIEFDDGRKVDSKLNKTKNCAAQPGLWERAEHTLGSKTEDIFC